MTSCSFTFYRW